MRLICLPACSGPLKTRASFGFYTADRFLTFIVSSVNGLPQHSGETRQEVGAPPHG